MVNETKQIRSDSSGYDEASGHYDFSRRAGGRTSELLIELLNPTKDAWILDLGCGTGNFLTELDTISAKLLGLDVSAGMLAQARAKTSRAELILSDGVAMPLQDRSFQAAYCILVLHHISDKIGLMSEVYRILHRQGRFVIQSCSHEQLSTFWFYHYFPRGLEIDRKRFTDFTELSGMLMEVGFKDISIHPCPFEALFKETPELYLDRSYRDGNSTFFFLTPEEIKQGCERIKEDVRSGRAAEIVREFDRRAQRTDGRVSFIRAIRP
ncbi:MAG TPA: class I SAM-dependent methyltransferase [bacterium]|nr:class I SAM-dependent methyltransferase [bacterium]